MPAVPNLAAQTMSRQGIIDAAIAKGIEVIDADGRLLVPKMTKNVENATNIESLTQVLGAAAIAEGEEPDRHEAERDARDLIESEGALNYGDLDLPKFKQAVRNRPYNERLFAHLRRVCITLANDTTGEGQTMATFLQAAAIICSNFFIGTGSRAGQLGRLADVYDTAKKANAARHPDTMQVRRIIAAIRRTCPWSPTYSGGQSSIPGGGAPTDLLAAGYTVRDRAGDENNCSSINVKANAGPPYSGKTLKGKIAAVLVAEADQMLATYTSARPLGRRAAERAMAEYNFLPLSHMKAKVEVTEVARLHVKVRNIYPTAEPLATLLGPIIKMSMHRKINCLTEGYSSRSLEGVAIFTDGVERILMMGRQRALEEGKSVLYYADNIFLFVADPRRESCSYTSADLKAEESCHRECDMLATLISMFTDVFGASIAPTQDGIEVKDPGSLNKELIELILQRAPAAYIDSITVLDDVQMVVPGMVSGCGPTFATNSRAIAPLIEALENTTMHITGDDGELNDNFHTICGRYGRLVKTEAKSPMLGADSPDEPAFELLFNPSDDNLAVTDIYDLELLGAGAFTIRIAGKYPFFGIMPALTTERYIKYLLFDKVACDDIGDGDDCEYDDDSGTLSVIEEDLRSLAGNNETIARRLESDGDKRFEKDLVNCHKLIVGCLHLGGLHPLRRAASLSALGYYLNRVAIALGSDLAAARLALKATGHQLIDALAALSDSSAGDNSGSTESAFQDFVRGAPMNLSLAVKACLGADRAAELRLAAEYASRHHVEPEAFAEIIGGPTLEELLPAETMATATGRMPAATFPTLQFE